jgi:hypothetical protein
VSDHIEREYREWRKNNPGKYAMIARRALRQRKTMKRGSISLIFDGLRAAGHGHLNNDFRALCSRDLMAEFPELDGLFEIRPRKVTA